MTVRGGTTGSRAAAEVFREGWAMLRVDGPRAARITADTAAVLSLVSMVAGWWEGPVAVALFALVLLGQTVVRLAPLRASAQAATAALLLAAAWAALVGAYQLIGWLDLAMHLIVTGLLAALAASVVLRRGWLTTGDGSGADALQGARAGRILLTTGTGSLLAVLWEAGEWFGHTYLDPAIQVGYEDTIGDLTAGVLGAALAGVFLGRLVQRDGDA